MLKQNKIDSIYRGCHLNCVTATYNKMYLEIVFIIKVE